MQGIYKAVSARLRTDKSHGHSDSTNFKLYFENLDHRQLTILREGRTNHVNFETRHVSFAPRLSDYLY